MPFQATKEVTEQLSIFVTETDSELQTMVGVLSTDRCWCTPFFTSSSLQAAYLLDVAFEVQTHKIPH